VGSANRRPRPETVLVNPRRMAGLVLIAGSRTRIGRVVLPTIAAANVRAAVREYAAPQVGYAAAASVANPRPV
jgi:hypothetical protein